MAEESRQILTRRLSGLAESRGWLSDQQGAFRRGRSTLDHVLHFTERIRQATSSRKNCVSAFIDVSKAYDTVWREGVLHRLVELGLRGRFLRWILTD